MNEKTDPIADKIAKRIIENAHKATLASFEARNAELRAMSRKQLLAEKRRLMKKARSLGLDPEKLLEV